MRWFGKKKEEAAKNDMPWEFDNFKDFFGKEARKEGNSAKFQAVVQAFGEYEKARSGMVSEESGKKLVLAHQALLTACETYAEGRKGARTSDGKERLDAVRRLVDFQKQQNLDEIRDLRLLNEIAEKNENKTWEQIGPISMPKITLTGNEDVIGAQVNRRFKVEYDGRTGFFTERKEVSSWDTVLKNTVERVEEPERRKLMEKYSETFTRILGGEVKEAAHGTFQINMKLYGEEATFDAVKEKLTLERDRSKDKKRIQELNQLIQDDKTINDLLGAVKAADSSSMAATTAFLEIDKGDELTDRNVATSRLADLLGVGDLVAHSRKMEAHVDGKIVKGSFMEYAKGISIDIRNQENREIIKQIGEIETPDFNRAAYNLEILDMISGQMDRHEDNMFYQLSEPDENGKRRVVGLQGIDNDFSFNKLIDGERLVNDSRQAYIDSLTFIDENFAERIKNVKREDLEFALGDLISKEQIDALQYRMSYVKQRLNSGNMVELKQDLWALDEYKLSDFEDCKRETLGSHEYIVKFSDNHVIDARGKAYVNGLLAIEQSRNRQFKDAPAHKSEVVTRLIRARQDKIAGDEARERAREKAAENKPPVREKVNLEKLAGKQAPPVPPRKNHSFLEGKKPENQTEHKKTEGGVTIGKR